MLSFSDCIAKCLVPFVLLNLLNYNASDLTESICYVIQYERSLELLYTNRCSVMSNGVPLLPPLCALYLMLKLLLALRKRNASGRCYA